MKVICIDGGTDWDSPLPVDLIEGKVYTVSKVKNEDNEIWYVLIEKPNDQYTQSAFMPCSEIDETEMERESLMVKI